MNKENITENDEFKNLGWTNAEKSDEFNYTQLYKEEKRRALLRMQQRKRKQELKKINGTYKSESMKERIKKFTTTKLLMYIILINCIAVEIYSMRVMYEFHDLSALYSLIGAVIGESLSFAIYCAKSFKESKEEALIQLEKDRMSINQEVEAIEE